MMAPWPPQLIFNTDGHWVINYQDRWAVEDIVKMTVNTVIFST